MRNAFIAELTISARLNPNIVLIVGDLGYGVVEEFAKELPNQFVNAGVAEQNMIGIAAGLASRGRTVFVYSIANFPTMRCLEQIRNDICYHDFDVKIVAVGAGTAYGTLGYSHHAVEDIAVMRTLPNIKVLSPADPIEARLSVAKALDSHGPVYIRLGKNGEPLLHDVSSTHTLEHPIKLREGSDALVLATGAIVGEAVAACDQLAKQGIHVAVVSCPVIKPLELDFILDTEISTPIFTLEDHIRAGGFGSAVLEYLNDHGARRLVIRLGIDHRLIKEIGDFAHLRRIHGIDAKSIASEILSMVHN